MYYKKSDVDAMVQTHRESVLTKVRELGIDEDIENLEKYPAINGYLILLERIGTGLDQMNTFKRLEVLRGGKDEEFTGIKLEEK